MSSSEMSSSMGSFIVEDNDDSGGECCERNAIQDAMRYCAEALLLGGVSWLK